MGEPTRVHGWKHWLWLGGVVLCCFIALDNGLRWTWVGIVAWAYALGRSYEIEKEGGR